MPFLGARVSNPLGTQLAATRLCRLPRFDPKSALISRLSLTLLLRTASPAIAALVAFLAIVSKLAIRVPGPGGGPAKHVFNPTNFGIAATLLLTAVQDGPRRRRGVPPPFGSVPRAGHRRMAIRATARRLLYEVAGLL